VTGNVKPGANTSIIVRSPNEESSNLTKKDHIVLWTGSNDVSRDNTKEGLKGIEECVCEGTQRYKYNSYGHPAQVWSITNIMCES
jgi:hypothetical protein